MEQTTRNNTITKQELWERKLLDLSLRNSLLNFRPLSSSVQLSAGNTAELENRLLSDDSFKIIPCEDGSDFVQNELKLYVENRPSDNIIADLDKKKINTFMTSAELEKALKKIHRQAKVSVEENGANTLYLALGFLKWYENDKCEKPRIAPILLIPVDIVRKNLDRSYAIRSRDEDPQINVTLLELLRQDFGIVAEGLSPLPADEKGVDLPQVFSRVAESVSAMKNWEIINAVFLGHFSFSRFIMWNDIKSRSEDLKQNKVVASLMEGRITFTDDIPPVNDPDDIDPSSLAVPTSADSSQLSAIYEASNGKSFVLHGPPGTGKSQTITNMIANALYQGKTVLFVAEKMAALSVVQKRLAKLGLDPFCLELHSNKTQKKTVLSQLEKTLNIRRTKEPEDYLKTAAQLLETRKKLNATISAVHKKQLCGMSLYELLVLFEQNAAHKGKLTISASNVTAEQLNEQRTAISELVNADKQAGGYVNSKLKAVELTEYTPKLRDEFVALSGKLIAAANEAHSAYTTLTGTAPTGISQAENIAYASKTVLESEYIMKAVASDDSYELKKEKADKIIEAGLEYEQLSCLVKEEFEDTVDSWNTVQASLEWKKAEQSWFLGKMLGKSKLLKQMGLYRKKGKPTDEEFVAAIERLARRQTLAESITSADSGITSLFGDLWEGKDTNFPRLNKSLSDSIELAKTFNWIKDNDIKEKLMSKSEPEQMKAYWEKYSAYEEITAQFTEKFGVNFTKVYGEYPSCFSGAAEEAGIWTANADSLREHSAVVSSANKVNALGLENVSKALMTGEISADEIMPSFLAGFTYTAANSVISAEPLLSQFRGAAFEDSIKKFEELDVQFAELTKRELVAKLSANVPEVSGNAADSSEIGMLLKTIKNKGRMTPIRKLFDNIPNLLPRMCPCMLMSPISVAQYIDPAFPKFDLVIFDEASQLPTSEAVGAIARGENVVVVGDPNQLPPTSFFTAEHVDEENLEIEDLESVLDDCLALAMPQQKLEWHYRSRHESLIAYSNAKYYENSLLTFPSPDDIVSRVKYIHVDGFYDKSGTRQNRAEAEAVVKEIVRRISDEKLRQESIGVVTFSLVQQILIDDLLSEEYRKNPELETLADSMYEPILIKNLENVQGDERDVIMFSIGYGPDKDGNISMNFGPLNRDGGWRRLNVAITRARKEMQVFATITPDMIDLDRTDADGVAGLRGFLEFAQRGTAALPKRTAVTMENDSLAEFLAAEIEKMGYKTRCNIGCSEYKIDIGVINPDDPESYILGIRCDGQRYLESGTARDRCISQPSVLSGLGWNIHNVWILDVYDNAAKVLAGIGNRIEAELQAYRNPPAPVVEEKKPEPVPVVEEEPEEAPKKPANSVVYESYNPSVMGKAEDFYEPKSDTKLRRICEAVIGTEAPVSTDVLIRKVISAFDITRVTEKAEERIREILSELPVTEIDGFIWQNEVMPDSFTIYRTPDERDEKRSMGDIPPQEIANAVNEIIKSQISMTRADLVRVTASVFGYSRIGGAIESAAEKGITCAIEKGFVKEENGRISGN